MYEYHIRFSFLRIFQTRFREQSDVFGLVFPYKSRKQNGEAFQIVNRENSFCGLIYMS